MELLCCAAAAARCGPLFTCRRQSPAGSWLPGPHSCRTAGTPPRRRCAQSPAQPACRGQAQGGDERQGGHSVGRERSTSNVLGNAMCGAEARAGILAISAPLCSQKAHSSQFYQPWVNPAPASSPTLPQPCPPVNGLHLLLGQLNLHTHLLVLCRGAGAGRYTKGQEGPRGSEFRSCSCAASGSRQTALKPTQPVSQPFTPPPTSHPRRAHRRPSPQPAAA